MRSRSAGASVVFIALAWSLTERFPGTAAEAWRALMVVPALLIVPGIGWVRRLERRLDRIFAAVGVGVLCGFPMVVLAQMGLHGAAFGLAATVAAWGWVIPGRAASPMGTGEKVGVAAVLVSTLAVGISWWPTVTRPLDANWWSSAAEQLPDSISEDAIPVPGDGWATKRRVGNGWVLTATDATLLPVSSGSAIIALRSDVGDELTVDDQTVRLERAPIEKPDEGSVPRYLDRGVASIAVTGSGTHQVGARWGRQGTVYVIPDQETLWELDGRGELKFVNYYQILNMVEQLNWVGETGRTRCVTDVQPPLWTWILATAERGNDEAPHGGMPAPPPELPTANILFLYICALIGLAGVRVIARWRPDAPLVAWCLPALALAEHAKLMLEPGSADLPDSAYTLAILGLAGSVGIGWGVVAQLLRYPGTLVSWLMLALDARWRDLARLTSIIVALVLGFGATGWVTGALDGWIATATWETGPEHWHGQADPAVLLARVPEFYGVWLGYAGLAPIIALSGWNRAVRVMLGTAFLYSLLLCTIDHFPSHYFLPLVQLSVLAVACASPGRAAWRSWLSVAGLAYALHSVPITG